jgi:WD40 repeat protein
MEDLAEANARQRTGWTLLAGDGGDLGFARQHFTKHLPELKGTIMALWADGRRSGIGAPLAFFVMLVIGLSTGDTRAQVDVTRPEIVLTTGHSDKVWAAAFSPDGRFIASSSDDGTVKIWDTTSQREMRTLRHDGWVRTVAFSPDGRVIVSGGNDKSLKVWDASSGRELRALTGHSDWVMAAAFSPDGRTIVSGSSDNTLKLWDAASGRELRTLTGHSGVVRATAFSPDGRIIVSGGGDAALKLWDVASGQELRTLAGHSNEVSSVAFSPDGRTILSGSFDKTLKLWDAVSGRELRTLTGHSEWVTSAAFSPDGRMLVSGSDDNTSKLWESSNGRELRTLRGHVERGFAQGGVKAVAFSPDGRTLVSGSADRTLKLWDAMSGADVGTLRGPVEVRAVAFSPDGRTIVSGNDNASLTLWDAASGQARRTLSGHSASVIAVAFSPDGRTIVSGGDDRTLRLWDGSSGRELRTLKGHAGRIYGVAFSPDGRSFASGSFDQSVRLWSTANGRELWTRWLMEKGFAATAVRSVVFSRDGRTILSGGLRLKLLNAQNGQELLTLTGQAELNTVAFSPDGRTIVSGSDRSLRVWDAATGGELRKLTGHSGGIDAVAFSPDGRTIVSGSFDRTLKLWDAITGQELGTLTGHLDAVTAVSFSPDGRTIVSGSADGTLRRWSADGQPLAITINKLDGDWLILTPEGFFDASSPKAAQSLNVVRGLDSYSIDQFYNQLYRPDLVREKLAGDPQGKVREAAAKLDLTKAVASGSAPQVVIIGPASGTTVQGEQATVDAEVTDQGGGIGKVEWRVNGVTLGVEERGFKRVDQGKTPASGARSIKISRTLGLTPDENKIAVLAYNEAGLIASEPAKITITASQQASARPRLYVLAVGVNDYWDSALKLGFAATDAKSFGDGLKQAGSRLYEQVEVRTVLDGEATAEKLDRVFTELGQKVRPQDVFVLFLAGHGKTVDARFYFLPQDFRYAGEDSITKTGVGQDQLQGWVSRIKAQKSVLLFDACESGSLIGDKIAMRGIEEKTAIDRLTRAMGRTVLTATTDSKPAIEGYRGHGVFTYTLLAGLDAADANNDGVIDVTELAQYVDRRLPELTYDAFKLRQVPQMSIVGSNFPLASKVALLPAGGQAPPAASIPTKPTHVVIAPATVRQSAGSESPAVSELPTGMQIVLIKAANGWALVARDGKKLGWVEETKLVRPQ